MDFRRHAQRLDEIGAGISGVTKAYWFLEKAGLSQELRKQVVAAAGGEYDYAKLRAAVMAIVPQVNKEEDGSRHHGHGGGNRQWRKSPSTAKVHATTQDETESADATTEDDEEGQLIPEMLEEELQVLLTQAAKKRAQVEKARGCTSGQPGKGSGKSERPVQEGSPSLSKRCLARLARPMGKPATDTGTQILSVRITRKRASQSWP